MRPATDSTIGIPQLGKRLDDATMFDTKSVRRSLTTESKNAGRTAVELHVTRLFVSAHEHVLAHAEIDRTAHDHIGGSRCKGLARVVVVQAAYLHVRTCLLPGSKRARGTTKRLFLAINKPIDTGFRVNRPTAHRTDRLRIRRHRSPADIEEPGANYGEQQDTDYG